MTPAWKVTLNANEGEDQMQDTLVEEILTELKMMIQVKKKTMHLKLKYPLPHAKDYMESPDVHLLAAQDWMEAMLFRVDDYTNKFKHTLEHVAREWYHGLDMDQFCGNWHGFTRQFSRYFSTQGRNIKHLHETWRSFSFDPNTDDREEYICDVHEAVKHLGYGDDVVLNLLKATMPTELYGTLYGHDNLYIVMTMLKDIYAKKPQPAAATAATTAQGVTAPFTLMCVPARASKAQDESSVEERIAQLTETLYRLDMDGKPVWKPFKPFITQPRRRFKGGFDKGHNGRCFSHPDEQSFPSD